MNLKVLFAVQKDPAKEETAKQRAHVLCERAHAGDDNQVSSNTVAK